MLCAGIARSWLALAARRSLASARPPPQFAQVRHRGRWIPDRRARRLAWESPSGPASRRRRRFNRSRSRIRAVPLSVRGLPRTRRSAAGRQRGGRAAQVPQLRGFLLLDDASATAAAGSSNRRARSSPGSFRRAARARSRDRALQVLTCSTPSGAVASTRPGSARAGRTPCGPVLRNDLVARCPAFGSAPGFSDAGKLHARSPCRRGTRPTKSFPVQDRKASASSSASRSGLEATRPDARRARLERL